MHLSDLSPGQSAVFTGFEPELHDSAAARQLIEMGFDDGVEITMLHRAAFGDPIAVRVGGMIVALRRAQSRTIAVAPLCRLNVQAAE